MFGCSSQAKSPAMRAYVRRLMIAMLCYVVSLLLAKRMIDGGGLYGPSAWALAVLPGLSIVGVFWAIGRLIVEERDEYVRMMFVKQSLIASGFALSIATIWGFLENFGLVSHVDGYYVAILWFIGLAVGGVINALAERRATGIDSDENGEWDARTK